MVIKPSGIAYEAMTLEDLVVVDLEGKVREGHRKPSSDTATHRAVPRLRRYWRRGAHPQPQRHHLGAGRAADPGAGHHPRRLLYGDIPCTRPMSEAEIAGDYEGKPAR